MIGVNFLMGSRTRLLVNDICWNRARNRSYLSLVSNGEKEITFITIYHTRFSFFVFEQKMLKSEVTCVSGPLFTAKRLRQTSNPSSESNSGSDDDEQRQGSDEEDREEGEVPSKAIAAPRRTPSAAPPRTGGLYMPPAKLRLLQVR